MMKQKGFIPIGLLVFVILMAGVATGLYFLPNTSELPVSTITPTPSPAFTSHFPTSALPAVKSPTLTVTIVPQNTGITIKGDENCKTKTQDALNLLQSRALTHYTTVIKYVGIIECASQGSGMYAWESPPRYQVGRATYEAGAIWYAGTIAHDSCHSKQYHDYLLNNNASSVPADAWTGKEAERQCLDVQYDALTKIGADQGTLDYIKNIINSEYWNVNYENRWW